MKPKNKDNEDDFMDTIRADYAAAKNRLASPEEMQAMFDEVWDRVSKDTRRGWFQTIGINYRAAGLAAAVFVLAIGVAALLLQPSEPLPTVASAIGAASIDRESAVLPIQPGATIRTGDLLTLERGARLIAQGGPSTIHALEGPFIGRVLSASSGERPTLVIRISAGRISITSADRNKRIEWHTPQGQRYLITGTTARLSVPASGEGQLLDVLEGRIEIDTGEAERLVISTGEAVKFEAEKVRRYPLPATAKRALEAFKADGVTFGPATLTGKRKPEGKGYPNLSAIRAKFGEVHKVTLRDETVLYGYYDRGADRAREIDGTVRIHTMAGVYTVAENEIAGWKVITDAEFPD